MSARRDDFTQVAEQTPFDNEDNGFIADNVQEAIEEVRAASTPSYSFGRSGNNVASGSWLLRPGAVPSNKTGIPIGTDVTNIKMITVGNEDLNVFTVEFYEHEGDEINSTLIATVNMDGTLRSKDFPVNISITSGKQLAVKIGSGSAKNVGVDVIVEGFI